jgi:8-oxo-dGTP diphosphatase
MPTPIAIAVVEHEGRFLIGQRPAGAALAGYWEFPGGKIEQGETPEAAAVRECLEETGLVVEALFRYPTQIEEYEHGSVELYFVGCKVLTQEFTKPRGPFSWVARQQLDDYPFPAGNLTVLQQLATNR